MLQKCDQQLLQSFEHLGVYVNGVGLENSQKFEKLGFE